MTQFQFLPCSFMPHNFPNFKYSFQDCGPEREALLSELLEEYLVFRKSWRSGLQGSDLEDLLPMDIWGDLPHMKDYSCRTQLIPAELHSLDGSAKIFNVKVSIFFYGLLKLIYKLCRYAIHNSASHFICNEIFLKRHEYVCRFREGILVLSINLVHNNYIDSAQWRHIILVISSVSLETLI